MSKHGLPGVVLGVIEGEDVIYLKGYGSAGDDFPMTPQTQMFIGSQSKSITALAIAQLAEQGKLDLDSPVQTYIPWFRVADEIASRQITIDHLLHHTSGLSEAGFWVVLPPNTTLEQAVRSLSKARLTAPVGTKHQYFNLGYDVLAYLIEVISGESYADYIQDHIFAPLGMDASTADPSDAGDLAQGYSRLFGFPLPMQQTVRAYEIGAGYIVSTAEDMARYAIAMLNGGTGLVSPKMMQRMFTPGQGAYGMGWIIVDGGSKIFHGGANETFRTEVNLYPDCKRAFILLTNQGHLIDHFVSAAQLTSSVEAIALGQNPPPVSQGWSMRWIGWGMGIACLALLALHTRNFLALRNWRERATNMPTAKQIKDVAVSFLIPTIILIVVFSQFRAFYENRFNLLTNIVYMPTGLPDVFILLFLVGTLPDYIQGMTKLFLWLKRPA
jgi:CubicO group peptidase (beta-lactamase class C family)